jgi:hypothetical protein
MLMALSPASASAFLLSLTVVPPLLSLLVFLRGAGQAE